MRKPTAQNIHTISPATLAQFCPNTRRHTAEASKPRVQI